MNAAQSDFLSQAEALTAHVDSLARGAVLGEDALSSLAVTLRAARVVARALDDETGAEGGADAVEEVMRGGTGDAVFRTAILALATKLIGRIRKITPSRHEATRKARVIIKAIALYLLFAKTDPSTLAGRCERVKASAKVALDLFTEANDGAGSGNGGGAHDLLLAAETLAAASYCVDAFVALEKEAAAAAAATATAGGGVGGGGGGKGLRGQLPAGEVEAVAIGVSKALEVLLALMWRGTTTTTPQGEQHPHPQQQRDTMEMARRVEALLRAALLRPALLGKRAVTVSGDVARRLSKAGQLRPARDCLVAALQALESMGTSGGWGGEGWKRTAQSALQWLLSECYSQLGDTEKALSGLYALEALQKAEAAAAAAEEGGAGGGGAAAVIPVHKVELAKIAFLLRGGTTEGLRAARACVLGLASASAGSSTDSAALLQAALKGARALVGFSRYTPESFAVFDEIEKQAHGSSGPSNSSSTLGPVARARALVLSTALQSTAAASPARQQALLAQLVHVLAPLTASPAAAAALGARDRERLRTAVRQAIWSKPLDFAAAAAAASSAPHPSSGGAEEDGDGHDEGGRKGKAQWWGQVTALCDALLALLEPGDAAGKEQALCTQSHALLELGRHDAAFAAAQRACGLLPAAGSGSDATTASSLLASTAGNSKARANLCWVACLVALKQTQQRATAATTTTTTGEAAGEQQQQQPQAPARSPVLVVLQALLAAPVPSGASGPSSARLSGLLELATLVAEVVAPAAPALAARLLKSVLEEVLRVWLEGATTAARPGSKRGRPGSAPSTSASSASFPLSVPLPAPTGGSGGEAHHDGDDDAMDTAEKPQQQKQGAAVGFFAACRALLEATLRCALGGKDGGGAAAAAAAYPAEAFADARAARECWRAVALFALPGLDKLQQALQRQQQEGGAAEATTLPNSLLEDLRWLSALCSNLATGVDSSNTHPTPGPANSTPTASRHDLLAAAYRLFEAAVTLPPAPAAAAEADERRRVVLLMLAVSASLAVRTGNEAGALSGRERSYWLAQLGEIRSRTAALSKTPALMPLARNLAKTAIVLELMVRGAAASTTTSTGASGGKDGEGGAAAVVGATTGLAQLLGREEGELLALPVEVLHALARACQDPAASPASEGNVAARKLYRLALKQATAQAQQQPAGAGQAAAQAQCFWLYLDLFQAAPTQSAALIVAKEFKQRADGYRPGAQQDEEGEGEGEDTPLVALRTVAARLAVAMYNEGVARLELVQADASVCVEAALALLPYAEESFQASFKDTMESMLSVAQELRSAEAGAVTASLLAGEGVDGEGEEEEGGGGKGGGVASASAAAVAMEE